MLFVLIWPVTSVPCFCIHCCFSFCWPLTNSSLCRKLLPPGISVVSSVTLLRVFFQTTQLKLTLTTLSQILFNTASYYKKEKSTPYIGSLSVVFWDSQHSIIVVKRINQFSKIYRHADNRFEKGEITTRLFVWDSESVWRHGCSLLAIIQKWLWTIRSHRSTLEISLNACFTRQNISWIRGSHHL